MRRLWWPLVGYNVAEVDEFVGRMRGTLGLEPLVGQPVTARDVEQQVFTESLGGYDKGDVNRELDRLSASLAQRNGGRT